MTVSFKGRDVELVTLSLDGFRAMAALQDRLLEPMPDRMSERAEVLVQVALGLAMLFAPSLTQEEIASATFEDLAPILTEGAKINNPGSVFTRPDPKPAKPQFSDGLMALANVMQAPKNARKVASRKRAEEIIKRYQAGEIPMEGQRM